MSTLSKNTCTIASGESASSVIDLGADTTLAVVMPSTFTGTALAVHVESSQDSTTFVPLYDDSNAAVSITVAASRAYGFSKWAVTIAPCERIKLVSGSTEGGARTIQVYSG